MVGKRKRAHLPNEEHTQIGIRIDRYEARARAAVNHYAYEPQYAWRETDEEPLYQFLTDLEIRGTSIYPAGRAGEQYGLTIYSQDAPSSDIYATLKDVQKRDEHYLPQYRTYRGKQIPVYVAPKGLGTIDKVRGELRWTGAIFVRPPFVSDLLLLLGQGRPLFIAIHEQRHERMRWVRSLCVQTTSPSQE